jgi:hypothetical protein
LDLEDRREADRPRSRQHWLRDPIALARMAYATLPKDILVSVEQKIPGGLSAEEEKIQVGMVPTHVQLPLDSRRQRAVKTGNAETLQKIPETA